jgi:hypothetical protein
MQTHTHTFLCREDTSFEVQYGTGGRDVLWIRLAPSFRFKLFSQLSIAISSQLSPQPSSAKLIKAPPARVAEPDTAKVRLVP